MSIKFSGTVIGLGEDNEVIASSYYYNKEKKQNDLINYSFSTNLFTYLDVIEKKYKNKLEKAYLRKNNHHDYIKNR